MKQSIVIIGLLLTSIWCFSEANAEEKCPDGTLSVVNIQNSKDYCIKNTVSPVLLSETCPFGTERLFDVKTNASYCIDVAKQTVNKSEISDSNLSEEECLEILRIKDSLRTTGWELDVGIGYAMVGAFDVRMSGGYHFSVENLDGLSFGIYAEVAGQLGVPLAFSLDVVPRMLIHGESFRVGVGFGLGYFYGKDISSDTPNIFEMRPEIRWDWALSEHIFLGFQASFPLLLIKQEHDAWDGWKKEDEVLGVQPWFDLDIYFGYRF